MDILSEEPRFTTARGTVERWRDQRLFRDAMIRLDGIRDMHGKAYRAEHPLTPEDEIQQRRLMEEGLRKQAEWFHQEYPGVPFVVEPPPRPWYLDIPDHAGPVLLPEIRHVTVAAPDRSRIMETYRHQSPAGRHVIRIVNGYTEYQRSIVDGQVGDELTQEHDAQPVGVEGQYWSQPHGVEAVALLAPRYLVYGWKERPGSRDVTEALGRTAYRIALAPVIPFQDPRMMGDELCPNYFNDTDELELVVDGERGVVLEWRYLLDGNMYERHFFSEIAFDVPLDRSDFDVEMS